MDDHLNWLKRRQVTVFLAIIYTVISVVVYLSDERIKVSTMLSLISSDVTKIPIFVIALLLVSGVEVSIGSYNHLSWILFGSSIVFLFRVFFLPQTDGPTYAVLCPFITFLMYHKPFYKFKIKDFVFDDTVFYFIFLFQFIAYDFRYLFIDLPASVISNFLYKILLRVIDKFVDSSSRIFLANNAEILESID